MPSDNASGPNKFAYAIALTTALGVALLAVGGTSYVPYALPLFVTALFCLSWAMRRTRRSREPPQDSEDELSDEEKRREKELKAEAGGYGGSGGGM